MDAVVPQGIITVWDVPGNGTCAQDELRWGEVSEHSRGKPSVMAADAEMESVKPLIKYGQPFLLWVHRVWYIRDTGLVMSNSDLISRMGQA